MSVESYGFKFVVDAKDAAKGYGDFQKAVDGVFSSLDRFEQHAKKVMDSVTSSSRKGQSDIAKYAGQFKALSNIPIDSRAAPALLKLSDAMARFKAPNTTQITNMRNFFRTLGSLPDVSGATRSIGNIAKLSAAMSGFKAPPAGQAEKLIVFAKALQQIGPGLSSLGKVAGVSGVANELASVSIALNKLKIPSASQAANLQNFARALQMMRLGGAGGMAGMLQSLGSINGFKAPSAAQTRNLIQFVHAINTLKVPANAGQIAEYLQRIASAANMANGSLKNFRGSLNSISWGGFSSGASKARLEMMGLQNAFSGTFQVGSLLRSMLGSLTIGELGREFFTAVQAANQFHASMEVLGQTPMMQSAEWDRVRADANHFGADLMTFSDGFSKFAVAAHESGMKLNESFKVYEGFQTVMSAMHLGQEQQQSVGLAIREIMDQGYVSTQRLTRQLGLVLPGSLATLQKAWKESGKQGVNFFDALKKKMVDGQWALDTLADHYKTVYGPALKAALESPIQQFNILRNNVAELMIQIGNDGAKKAFADFVAKLSGGLDPSHMKAFAQSISDGLVKAIHRAGDAVDWLKANWDSLKGPLATALSLMGKWMIISAALKIGSSIISPLLNVRRALVGFNTAMVETVATGGRTRAVFTGLMEGIQPLPTGLGRLNMSAMAATAGMNALRLAGNGLKAGLSGLVNLLGGPVGIAMLGLGAVVGLTASHIMSAKIQINDMSAAASAALTPLHDQEALLRQTAGSATAAANGVAGAGQASAGASGFIVQCGNAAQTAADKFFNLAMQARSAMLAMNQKQIMDLQQQNVTAQGMTSQGSTDNYRSKLPGWLGGGGKGFSSMKDWYNSFTTMEGASAAHAWDNGESDKGLTASIKKNNDAIKQLLSYRAQIMNASNKQIMTLQSNGMEEPPPVTDPLYKGTNAGDKKTKGKKGQSLDSMENGVSSMMDKLMEGDPVGKLYAEFVQNLTKEGQTLLNDKSYKVFLSNLTNDAAKGKVSVEALIDQLEKGGGKKKVLDDIAKRYGVDVKDIINMLRTEQSDYYKNVQDATIKQIDAQHKVANDLMKRFAEDDPLLKLQQDYTDDLVDQAQKLLTNGSFKAWYDETTSGAQGAATATERLLAALKNASNYNPQAVKGLAAYGKTIGKDGVAMVQRSASANVVATVKTTRDQAIGATTIDQMKQQYQLLQLNDRETEVANKLLEEYNRQIGLKRQMTQEEINTYQTQLQFWQKQIDYMQQMKEYYQNNGIHKYIQDIQTAGDFVHDFDNNALKGLEDTLYTLGTTGKLSFSGMIDSMQQSIIRFASQNLVKNFINMLMPNQGNEQDPTMFGFLGKMLGGTTGFTPKAQLGVDQFHPMFVSIVPGGSLSFAPGAGQMTAAGNGMLPSTNMPSVITSNGGLSSGSTTGSSADPVTAATTKVATSFQSQMAGMMPLIGLAFAGAFKSPIAQIGVMFASMMLQKMLMSSAGGAGGGGGGGILGSLLGLFGGGGGGGAIPTIDVPAFPGGLEGGIVGSLVNRYNVHPSAFIGAPHYADGTPNTSGGHPAILHDNEAVIPLSRGRKVPVELTGMSSPANGGVTVNNHFNISSPDADSFRKSKSQIATDLHAVGARSWSRNN